MFRNLHLRLLAQNVFSETQIWMVASGIQWTFGYLRYGRQHAKSFNEDIIDPIEGEGDHLFVIKVNEEVNLVIQKIVQ